jgi:hypothetical protein
MEAISILLRSGLALLFAVAGVTKLRDQKQARTTLWRFGVPQRYARIGAVALPVAELVVAAILIPNSTAWVGSVAAFVLLSVFSGTVLVNLVRGRRPECNCMGHLHSRAISAWTLAGNLALAALALLLAAWASEPPASLSAMGSAISSTR